MGGVQVSLDLVQDAIGIYAHHHNGSLDRIPSQIGLVPQVAEASVASATSTATTAIRINLPLAIDRDQDFFDCTVGSVLQYAVKELGGADNGREVRATIATMMAPTQMALLLLVVQWRWWRRYTPRRWDVVPHGAPFSTEDGSGGGGGGGGGASVGTGARPASRVWLQMWWRWTTTWSRNNGRRPWRRRRQPPNGG